MTLEDFFTLTEMKNGLTTCSRVEELIGVMQKLNFVSNNVGDAARQWSTAATTLACTQNKECLSLFVNLNGLGFLNQWLQEAVKCNRDVGDGEELIHTLIGSLDKLPTNPEKLSSSGIFTTVEKLFDHSNVNIKERARMLLDKWNNRRDNDTGCQEMEKDSSYHVDSFKPSIDTPAIEFKHAVIEAVENSSCQIADEGSYKIESGRIQNLMVTSDNNLRLGDVDDVKCLALSQTLPPTTLSSEAGQTNFSVHEGNLISKQEMAFSTTTAPPEIQVQDDDPFNTSVRHDVKAEGNMGKGDSWEFRETSRVVLSSSGLSATSHTKNPKVVRSASCNLTLNEGKPILLDTKEALHRCASVDGVWSEYSKTMKEVKSGEHDSTDNLDSSKGSSWRKEAVEDTGDIDHCDEPTLNTREGVDTFIYDDPPKTSNDQVTRKMEGSDSEPESGEMDALEIARLVAIEVEREVVDYREELCSSSPEVSSNEVMNTASPSVEDGKQSHPILGEANGNESVAIKDDCDVTSSLKHDNHMFADMATDPSKQEQSLESPNGAAVIQESRGRAKMGKFDFDLNEDACTEDIDFAVNPFHPNNIVNFSAPIAVSASKGAPGFLIPLQSFEGGLGWKGSAATSAFRPASPRRAAFDGEKSELGSKYKANMIELDLNVTDYENYLPLGTASIKEVPVSSSMPSWNSSSEVNSLRTERIKLDLNSNGEDEATPSHSPLVKHHFLNGGQISSPSSSSSLKQPPRKNFDLNDNLFSSDAAVSKNINLSKAANPYGDKIDDPIITIMGTRLPAERRAHHQPIQTHQSYVGNGLSFDSSLPAGPILPYPHQIPHPSYGYVTPGPGMALPFQPAAYGFGSIPHMVDSRGATVVPQLLSSSGPNGTPLTTLPYLMSITNNPSSSNGGGASQPGLDLNFGIMQMENGTTEQINSGNSLKRKEPESGWEPYSFGYKHLASRH